MADGAGAGAAAAGAAAGTKRPGEEAVHTGAATVAKRQQRALHPLRVLVVDDSAVSRRVAVRLFDRQSCTSVAVESGAEALKALQENGPSAFDIVLLDVRMDGMDGLETARAIRTLEAERRAEAVPPCAPFPSAPAPPPTPPRLRIVGVTALGEDLGATARAAGMDACLAKPTSSKALLVELNAVRALRSAETSPAAAAAAAATAPAPEQPA